MLPFTKKRLQRSSCLRHNRHNRWSVSISGFTDSQKCVFLVPFHFPSWQSSRTGAPAPSSWWVMVRWSILERQGCLGSGSGAVWAAAHYGQAGQSQDARGSVACFSLMGSTENGVLWQHRNEGLSAHSPRGRQSSAMLSRANHNWATLGGP